MKFIDPAYPNKPDNSEDESLMDSYWKECHELARKADDNNLLVLKEHEEKRLEFRAMALQIFGGDSSEIKYLDRQLKKVPHHYIWHVMNLETRKLHWKENLDRKKRETEDLKKKQDQEDETIAKNVRAALWLSNKGIDDFDPLHALERANEVAAELELAGLKSCGGWLAFAGDDGCENCSGWDGVSRRCECGNRRVSWEVDRDFSFENPSFHAVAW